MNPLLLERQTSVGSVGARISKMLGEDPEVMIREDLQRFKELMETGSVSSTSSKQRASGTESKWTGTPKGRKMWDRDNVTYSSEESFPASDAPSWTPETL